MTILLKKPVENQIREGKINTGRTEQYDTKKPEVDLNNPENTEWYLKGENSNFHRCYCKFLLLTLNKKIEISKHCFEERTK